MTGSPAIPEASAASALVFVGPMAAGKTSIGRRVARELGWEFHDTDARIVAGHGPITEIFAEHGEAHFRALEEEAVRSALTGGAGRIVSLGGGAVLSSATRQLLRGFPVVLLTTTQEAVLSRTNLDKRPLLKDDPEAWGRIYAERLPLYREVADQTWASERRPKEHIAAEITAWFRANHAPAEPIHGEAKDEQHD
ncbi:shikimate kinase [Leucobacter sp. M11]|uniref:shikimate kinase n=1 Tax=Leucobacter sp. M11 TaxID=2993565 RepID=UPI002D7F1520|nr:shikimate kinase [Leucobacter sp. M11]MEB4616229.1 shikimate kinase [Leucobacter sp. M11]